MPLNIISIVQRRSQVFKYMLICVLITAVGLLVRPTNVSTFDDVLVNNSLTMGGIAGFISSSELDGTANTISTCSACTLTDQAVDVGTIPTTVLRINCTTAECTLNGLVAPTRSRLLIIADVGPQGLIITNNGGGVAANQFNTPNGSSWTLSGSLDGNGPGSLVVAYDLVLARWVFRSWSSGYIGAGQLQITSTGFTVRGANTFEVGGTTQFDSLATATNGFTVSGGAVSLNGTSATVNTNGLQDNGNFTITTNGNIIMQGTGHLRTQGNAVSFTSCGATPSPTCNSTTCNDTSGTFTTGGTATTCTINFATTFTGADDASCIVAPMGTATQPVYTTSATAITMSTSIAQQKYHYICPGH